MKVPRASYSFYAAAQGRNRFDQMTDWCYKNLYHGGYYEPNWHAEFPYIYFTDEQEFTWFNLRWA